jgi:hypothetical protein
MHALLGGWGLSWEENISKCHGQSWHKSSDPTTSRITTNHLNHVNYLELFTAYWALSKWKRELAGHLVVLHIDSMVALYCLASMSSKTLVFIPLLRVIARILMKHDIRLKLTYISTTANVIADCLSRGGVGFGTLLQKWYHQLPSLKRDFEDWMLHTMHFRSLDRKCGPVSITACADAHGRNSHTRVLVVH